MTDQTQLQTAAQRKRGATLERATSALTDMVAEGATVTFQQVARRASVSRQWLYGQPELRAEIEQRRQYGESRVPSRQRTTDASRHQRLRAILDDNQRLRTENQDLKRELALAYGRDRILPPLAVHDDHDGDQASAERT
jgi:hypothetical protein